MGKNKSMLKLLAGYDLALSGSTGEPNLVLPVTRKWIAQTEKLRNASVFASAVSSVTGLGIAALSLLFDRVDFLLLTGVALIVYAPATYQLITSRKQLKRGQVINETVLNSWLIARYQISVTPTVLVTLTSMVSDSFFNRKSYDFQSNNKIFTLSVDRNGGFYVTEKQMFSLDRGDEIYSTVDFDGHMSYDSTMLADSAVWKKADGTNLRGKASLLFDSISDRLDRLRNRNLDMTNEHIVVRVENDLVELISAHDELLALGSDMKRAGSILITLSALDVELANVLTAEIASVQYRLDVQAVYVKERQVEQGLVIESSLSTEIVVSTPNMEEIEGSGR